MLGGTMLAGRLIMITWPILDEKASKALHKDKDSDQRKIRNTTLEEVRPAKNISKNPWSFLELCLLQIEVLPSHKLQDHAWETESFWIKRKKTPQRDVATINWVFDKHVRRVWFKERFTSKKIWKMTSNIGKATF